MRLLFWNASAKSNHHKQNRCKRIWIFFLVHHHHPLLRLISRFRVSVFVEWKIALSYKRKVSIKPNGLYRIDWSDFVFCLLPSLLRNWQFPIDFIQSKLRNNRNQLSVCAYKRCRRRCQRHVVNRWCGCGHCS